MRFDIWTEAGEYIFFVWNFMLLAMLSLKFNTFWVTKSLWHTCKFRGFLVIKFLNLRDSNVFVCQIRGCLLQQHIATLIVEVGRTETMPHLRNKAHDWATVDGVAYILIIKVRTVAHKNKNSNCGCINCVYLCVSDLVHLLHAIVLLWSKKTLCCNCD